MQSLESCTRGESIPGQPTLLHSMTARSKQRLVQSLRRLSGRTRIAAAASVLLGSAYAVPASAAPAAFVVESDVSTGITSDADVFVSLRYMRHLWITPDGVQAAVVQQGTNGALGLYKSIDDGLNWTWEQDLPSASDDVSDGIMLDDGSLLLVTSIVGQPRLPKSLRLHSTSSWTESSTL